MEQETSVLPPEPASDAPAVQESPAPRGRRFRMHWWTAAIYILLVMILVFLLSFRMLHRFLPQVFPVPQPTTAATVPAETCPILLPPLPEPSVPLQTNCFTVEDGVLRFLPAKYQGYPVLQIPAEILDRPVRSIAPETFAGCEDITTILLPQGLESIGERAFAGCSDLRGICIPDTVTEIGSGAFSDCIRLEAIYIPLSVRSVGQHALQNCNSLNFIFYSGFHEDWVDLYNEFVTPYTIVLCLDGDFRQAALTS